MERETGRFPEAIGDSPCEAIRGASHYGSVWEARSEAA
jgi:hypothetical protein